MKTLLISANTEVINMPVMPFGLACVASAAQQAGHDAVMLDLMFASDPNGALKDALVSVRPGCIGVSLRNIDDQNMESPRFLLDEVRDVIAFCRKHSDAPIVVGGAGYSIFPESALAFLDADMGIEGEGEKAFPALLSCLERGRDVSGIPGIHLRDRGAQQPRSFARDMDAFRMPVPTVLAASAARNPDPWIPAQTRRGCPFHCAYCTTPAIEGARLRKRAPEDVVAWLQQWVAAGYNQFFFVDNTFNFPPSYAKELCRLIIAHGLDIQWQSIIYPKNVDVALVGLMADAGCKHISLGFESGCEDILRNMNKRFTPDEARVISDMFGARGIERMGFLLLGGPGETQESVETSLAYADALNLEMLSVTPGIRICPNTPLAATAVEHGIVTAADDLLRPRFYLARELDGWLQPRLKQWAASRPYVML